MLHLIGDPCLRFREDPVRMLRAVRSLPSSAFDHRPEDARRRSAQLAALLENVPAGAAVRGDAEAAALGPFARACLAQLRKEGLHHGLLPLLDVIVEQPLGGALPAPALDQTDTRMRAGKSVSPAFLFAALLWHEVLAAWKANEGKDMRGIPALYLAMDQVLDAQTDKLSIPRRFDRDDEGDLGAAAALGAALRASAPWCCSTIRAFAPATISCCCAPKAAKCRRSWPNWWTRFQDAEVEERNAMLIADVGAEEATAPPAPEQGRRRGGACARAGSPGDDWGGS